MGHLQKHLREQQNSSNSDAETLLQLPDTLLLAVLQCLADDPASLAAAALAHSRLCKAAVLAPGASITARISTPEQLDSLLLYLKKHGQHIDSIILSREWSYVPAWDAMDYVDSEDGSEHDFVTLWQFPANLQLQSLNCSNLVLDLPHSAGDGFQQVLVAGAPLKKLRLSECLLDGICRDQALADALAKLPSLEHLCIDGCKIMYEDCKPRGSSFDTKMFEGMQLTYLKLAGVGLCPEEPNLQALTSLVDLRLRLMVGGEISDNRVAADMLSDVSCLTRLELLGLHELDARVLAGKTRLQHLDLSDAYVDVSELLSQLQHMQQLTRLNLSDVDLTGNAPAAAFSALTASSKLQHLLIRYWNVPAGIWQHMFPTGRQLSCLRSLDISYVKVKQFAAAAEGRRLVACCPSLRYIRIYGLPCEAELRTALQGIDGLRVG